MFPSPIGELHFSILRAFICWQSVHQVSVPYRGATFLNNLRILLGRLNSVSVPSRGATFLNWIYKNLKNPEFKFPSPIGELHFSMVSQSLNGYNIMSLEFPSPIGELHFSIILGLSKAMCCFVSVPYRGATFLNVTFHRTVKRQ